MSGGGLEKGLRSGTVAAPLSIALEKDARSADKEKNVRELHNKLKELRERDPERAPDDLYTQEELDILIDILTRPPYEKWKNVFPVAIIQQILNQAQATNEDLPRLLELEGEFSVFGDVHGNYTSTYSEWNNEFFDFETYKYHDIHVVFLGDVVDRGSQSLRTVLFVILQTLRHPDHVHYIRGNHELSTINRFYGLREELGEILPTQAIAEDIFLRLNLVFDRLPVAVLMNKKILGVHGGISEKVKTLDDIKNIPNPLVPTDPLFQGSIGQDILWSDYVYIVFLGESEIKFINNTDRRCSFKFNPEALRDFLKKLNIEILVRAHSAVSGANSFDGRRLVNAFSCVNYKRSHNRGSVMKITRNMEISFHFYEDSYSSKLVRIKEDPTVDCDEENGQPKKKGNKKTKKKKRTASGSDSTAQSEASSGSASPAQSEESIGSDSTAQSEESSGSASPAQSEGSSGSDSPSQSEASNGSDSPARSEASGESASPVQSEASNGSASPAQSDASGGSASPAQSEASSESDSSSQLEASSGSDSPARSEASGESASPAQSRASSESDSPSQLEASSGSASPAQSEASRLSTSSVLSTSSTDTTAEPNNKVCSRKAGYTSIAAFAVIVVFCYVMYASGIVSKNSSTTPFNLPEFSEKSAILAQYVNGIWLGQSISSKSLNKNELVNELLPLGPTMTLDDLSKSNTLQLANDIAVLQTLIDKECTGDNGCGISDSSLTTMKTIYSFVKYEEPLKTISEATKGNAMDRLADLQDLVEKVRKGSEILDELPKNILNWLGDSTNEELTNLRSSTNKVNELFSMLRNASSLIDEIETNVLKNVSSNLKSIQPIINIAQDLNSHHSSIGLLFDELKAVDNNYVNLITSVPDSKVNEMKSTLNTLKDLKFSLYKDKKWTSGFYNGFDGLKSATVTDKNPWLIDLLNNGETLNATSSKLSLLKSLSDQLTPLFTTSSKLESSGIPNIAIFKVLLADYPGTTTTFEKLIVDYTNCANGLKVGDTFEGEIQKAIDWSETKTSTLGDLKKSIQDLVSNHEKPIGEIFNNIKTIESDPNAQNASTTAQIRKKINDLKSDLGKLNVEAVSNWLISGSVVKIRESASDWIKNSRLLPTLRCIGKKVPEGKIGKLNPAAKNLAMLKSGGKEVESVTKLLKSLEEVSAEWSKLKPTLTSQRKREAPSELQNGGTVSKNLGDISAITQKLNGLLRLRTDVDTVLTGRKAIDSAIESITDQQEKNRLKKMWSDENIAAIENNLKTAAELADQVSKMNGIANITDFKGPFEKASEVHESKIDIQDLADSLNGKVSDQNVAKSLESLKPISLMFAKYEKSNVGGVLKELEDYFDSIFPNTKIKQMSEACNDGSCSTEVTASESETDKTISISIIVIFVVIAVVAIVMIIVAIVKREKIKKWKWVRRTFGSKPKEVKPDEKTVVKPVSTQIVDETKAEETKNKEPHYQKTSEGDLVEVPEKSLSLNNKTTAAKDHDDSDQPEPSPPVENNQIGEDGKKKTKKQKNVFIQKTLKAPYIAAKRGGFVYERGGDAIIDPFANDPEVEKRAEQNLKDLSVPEINIDSEMKRREDQRLSNRTLNHTTGSPAQILKLPYIDFRLGDRGYVPPKEPQEENLGNLKEFLKIGHKPPNKLFAIGTELIVDIPEKFYDEKWRQNSRKTAQSIKNLKTAEEPSTKTQKTTTEDLGTCREPSTRKVAGSEEGGSEEERSEEPKYQYQYIEPYYGHEDDFDDDVDDDADTDDDDDADADAVAVAEAV